MKLRPPLFGSLLLASAGLAAAQSADLRVSASVDKSKPLFGTTLQLSVVVFNDGIDDATGVAAADLLPDGYELVSATPESGSYDSMTGIWSIGNLGAGLSSALDITAKVLTSGGYKYDVSVSGNETDPNAANNSASVTPVPTWNLYWEGGTADVDPVVPPDGVSLGGSGTWDTTLKNWDSGVATANYVAWDNASGYAASFGGTAGTVALGANVSARNLAISGAYTIATGANTLTLTGTGITLTGNAGITISGTGAVTLGSSQTWDNTSGTMTVSAPVSTGANLLTLNTRSNGLDVTGKISGSGGLTVNSTYTTAISPSNSGSATLNNSNDYTGTTTLNGFIWLSNSNLGALGTDPSDIILNSGGFRLQGTATVTRGLSLTGSCGVSMISGAITLNGKITGAGSFNISGNYGSANPVVLGAANDFTGDCITGPDGVARLAHVDALSKASMAWNDNNGRAVFDLATANLSYVIGGLKSAGNKSNNVNLGSGGAAGSVSFGANGQTNTYVGILSGTSGFKKVGAGTQTIIGANTYAGNTVIAEGTLKLGKIAGQTGVACTTGTTGTNVKRLSGLPTTAVSNLYIGQAVTGPLIPTGARITNINTTSQVTLDPGPITPNTATTVDFPDIVGSVAASPVIEVESGAIFDVSAFPWTLGAAQTLGGTGTVTGAVVADGTVAPGLAATGTLTTGDVSFGSTGVLACTLDGANGDLLAAAALTIDPAATITVTGTPALSEYVIATYTGAAPAGHFDESALPSGYGLDYNTTGQIKLVINTSQSPYQAWAAGAPNNLAGQDALPGADPDGDGVKNIVEFALGGDPKSGSANGPSLAKVQNAPTTPALTLTIATRTGTTFDTGSGARTAAKDGVTYTVQAGTDLAVWTATVTEVTPALTAGLPAAPSGYEYHTFKTAGPVSSIPKDFMRVKVVGQ